MRGHVPENFPITLYVVRVFILWRRSSLNMHIRADGTEYMGSKTIQASLFNYAKTRNQLRNDWNKIDI